MNSNSISWIEITGYDECGIYSDSGTDGLLISNMSFNNIAPNDSGRYKGAVVFYFAEDLEVKDSYFEDVSSGVTYYKI